MKRVLINFQRSIELLIGRMQHRFQRSRSGTILIMVVALLVLLALMGTAFIATARLDRQSTGELKLLTNWQEIADSLAQQALSTASTWIVADQQTFTSHTADATDGNAAGDSIYSGRDPVIYGPSPSDLLMNAAAAKLASTVTNTKSTAVFVAWPHITQPIGYKYFVSPIVPTVPAASVPAGFTAANNNTYDLGPLGYMMVPSNVVISYPATYSNSDLQGRTWTFPAFYRLSQTASSSSATPSWQVDGPFLAADATGWGIADSALVPLNMPATNGITWYAAWRIVDDAAAVNVNTAFTPSLDLDAGGNCQNYFPNDVDLIGLLSAEFNGGASGGTQFAEFLAINARRYARYNTTGFTAANTYPAIDDASVTHTDMQYSNDAEIIWSNLGRRLDYPANFTSAGGSVQAGDPQKSYQRPFDESDTGALGYRGVMVQSDGPASKFETILSALTNPSGDSIYRSAVNYMANTNNQFKFFEPNQVAYWYDWNFNYDFPYDWAGNPAHSSTSVPIFNGPSSVPALSTLTIGNSLGTSANTTNNYIFRTPRADAGATSRIMNLVRTVDPAVVAKVAVGSGASVIPALTSGIPHKACLNTALFGELWRAYINVLNDFPSQDGVSTPAGINNANGYYNSLNVPGGAVDTGTTNPCNPVQFRSVMRDPTMGSSVSANGTCPQNASTLAMQAQDVLALRAACGATNMLTLRDQHGLLSGGYFMPRRSKQTITLTPQTATGTGPSSYNVTVYGVSAQPFITEVYVSNDTSVHGDQTPASDNGTNAQGLVVIKLYNPYPYAISLAGYGFALVDRSGFSSSTMNVQMMDTSATTPLLSTVSIQPNSYAILANFKPGTNYWPSYLGVSPDLNPAIPYVEIDNLTQAIGGTGSGASVLSGNKDYELLLLAPTDPSAPGNPEAPVDSYDFSGFPVPGGASTSFTAWHYLRMSGNSTTTAGPINPSWKCVFPGPYSGIGFGGAASPHFQSDVDPAWTAPAPDPWAGLIEKNFHLDMANAYDSQTTTNLTTTPPNSNPYPGIPLCNVDFGGYNKAGTPQYPPPGGKAQFPFGGFARVGDAVQAPFIGSYVIMSGGASAGPATNVWPPTAANATTGATATSVTVAEVNPVTVDTCFADDGDTTDDAQEQIGRCVPIVGTTANGIDDYSMSGAYSTLLAVQPTTAFQNIVPAVWRYHFGLEILNQFTAVSNPDSDYFPNMEPGSWAGSVPPYPVSNTTATAVVPNTPVANDNANKNGSEDGVGVEGLINVNTASWRMLAAVELIPHSQDPNGALNEQLAQAIVHYRDVDDGVTRYATALTRPTGNGMPWTPVGNPLPPRGHGPFNSLLELNQVFDYTKPSSGAMPNGRRIYTNTFQNAFGALPAPAQLATEAMRHKWGYYTPGPLQTNTGNLQSDDWVQQYLMVNRVSNLLTTRSDTFTVYVIVQGWRNVGASVSGSLPELVVQRRMAMTVNRCGLVHNSGTPATVQMTTK